MEKKELLKELDELIIKMWNNNELSNELKNEVYKKLQEAQILIQEGKLL